MEVGRGVEKGWRWGMLLEVDESALRWLQMVGGGWSWVKMDGGGESGWRGLRMGGGGGS